MSHHDAAHLHPQLVSLPIINFLHLMVSGIQPGQIFYHCLPTCPGHKLIHTRIFLPTLLTSLPVKYKKQCKFNCRNHFEKIFFIIHCKPYSTCIGGYSVWNILFCIQRRLSTRIIVINNFQFFTQIFRKLCNLQICIIHH